MNATGKFGVIALVLSLAFTAGAAGQAGAPPETRPPTRQDVDALLAQAKQAMQQSDFATADKLIGQAESAGVRYPLFYRGDTPSRLRRALEQSQRNASHSRDPFLQAPANPFAASGPAAPEPRPLPPVTADAQPAPTGKALADQLVTASRAALELGNLQQAEEFARRASELAVPEAEFGEGDSPARLAWDLQRRRMGADTAVRPATAEAPLGAVAYGQQALHIPEQDITAVQPATAEVAPAGLMGPAGAQAPRVAQSPYAAPAPGGDRFSPAPTAPQFGALPAPPAAAEPSAAELMARGEEALRNRDVTAAWRSFQLAREQRDQLTPAEQARLDGHLQMLTNTPVAGAAPQPVAPQALTAQPLAPPNSASPTGSSMFDSADEAQRVLVRQLSSDVGQKTLEAREIRNAQPREALQLLQDMKGEVEKSQLADNYRLPLMRRVDSAIAETEKYITENKAQIELDERNAAVLADVERSQATKLKLQQTKAEMVDKFNTLIKERRYSEAQLIAAQLYELMPNDEVAVLMNQQGKMLQREMFNRQLRDARDDSNWNALANVESSSLQPVGDGTEMAYDLQYWGESPGNRRGLGQENSRMTERELLIQQKLEMPVQVNYQDTPLSQVIEDLKKMTGMNIHLDPRGMSQEGVSSDTPVTLDLNTEVMLKSALDLILKPLHLSYLIKSEVLLITSEQLRDGEIDTITYYVADLVTPIPNFVPSNNIGLQSMINDAYAALGYGRGLGAPGPIARVGGQRPNGLANNTGSDVLAQQLSGPQFGGPGGQGGSLPLGMGGPSPGGGVNADFDSLIDLIISTIATESWAENGGGEAEIRPYVNNLSLVVSQTQAVHEQIADLLQQLRRLQDLQITIEVRFIRLNDSFFERIGIDFDVNINDRTVGADDLLAGGDFETPGRSSQTLGVVQQVVGDLPVFSSDLDIPFRQGSFGVAVPQFGGFDAGQAASFGFAILSDIEAYFLINAAQGDTRTNVLNAPKVTLFNGQTAFVADASQMPFVISVVPVVGEFAAAQQPVIVVLSEGTMMNIQAVVSEDRRYVRLTVVPFFSDIGDVQTFTFEGSSSTDNSSSTTDADDDGTNESNDNTDTNVTAGTTVQLPTFSFISVSTTVSVPDGGTVLLGGIKRLNEGRNEFGVPLLSKVPYINRLFRNVGIGRETDSLMMMVTPRIIIQEEEEAKLLSGN
ncbi:MAG: hypothetical protein AAGJ46_15620 [Planctomycetota bacterium]